MGTAHVEREADWQQPTNRERRAQMDEGDSARETNVGGGPRCDNHDRFAVFAGQFVLGWRIGVKRDPKPLARRTAMSCGRSAGNARDMGANTTAEAPTCRNRLTQASTLGWSMSGIEAIAALGAATLDAALGAAA